MCIESENDRQKEKSDVMNFSTKIKSKYNGYICGSQPGGQDPLNKSQDTSKGT